ncbi:MAG TPA: ATP-binding cassette domain-containing protein [Bacteroidales bacterium]|nr:ATP-binding cassette domain-containing protein [Bacteroidales bacterium]HRZ48908.1 ATP-binding cassette domain-containing protein [Bacteroidales bacterium]
MIRAVNISKRFDGHQVLDGISIQFEPGLTNLIIGESGSGKTVLMKCIVGLFKVDSGTVYYDNRDFTAMKHHEMKLLRKEIGMLFQGAALFDSMTVLDNVMFPLKMLTNLTYKQRVKRAIECLDRVNLHGSNRLLPAEISGGMKKRVAIARAIAINPRYLFCDEPNSGLDPRTATLIDNLIAEITKEYGMTTIVNTHDMNSVIGIGDKISFIHEGKLWWDGDRHSVLEASNPEIRKFLYTNQILKHFRPEPPENPDSPPMYSV